jgi:hypothetical protein
MFFSDYRCHYAIKAYRVDVTRRRAREMFERVITTRRREERYADTSYVFARPNRDARFRHSLTQHLLIVMSHRDMLDTSHGRRSETTTTTSAADFRDIDSYGCDCVRVLRRSSRHRDGRFVIFGSVLPRTFGLRIQSARANA